MEDARIANVEKPLFGVFRMPHANNIDVGSPYSLPIFSEAVQELRDLDIAYSRNAKEVIDSKRTVLIDSDRVLPNGKIARQKAALGQSVLPDFVQMVDGNGGIDSDIYHEINPQLNTDTRIKGINALLSQIGYKSGYSNGYYVFNEASGIQTATGVEAEQQRTVQTIKDVRDQLEFCHTGLIYALNAFADLYALAPGGAYEVAFDFGDITYDLEHDRARWWGYVTSGKVPAWMFFVKFEGMTEAEAKAMVAEAAPKQPTLFGGGEE
jgi:A118 family predicted phage portal protein